MSDDFELSSPPLKPPLHNTSAPRDREPEDADLARLKAWHEERMTRKLKGEYETAVFHLSELVSDSDMLSLREIDGSGHEKVNDNLQSPARIAAIRVEGATHTRRSFLNSLVHPFLVNDPDKPQTLENVLHSARAFGHVLHETDIFQSIGAKLEASRDVYASSGDVDVVFKTKEKGRFYLSTSTEVGNNEGGAVSLRSPFDSHFELSTHCRARAVVSATFLVERRLSKRIWLSLQRHAYRSTRHCLRRSHGHLVPVARSRFSAWRGTTRFLQAIRKESGV